MGHTNDYTLVLRRILPLPLLLLLLHRWVPEVTFWKEALF